jgi:hypothetical protein
MLGLKSCGFIHSRQYLAVYPAFKGNFIAKKYCLLQAPFRILFYAAPISHRAAHFLFYRPNLHKAAALGAHAVLQLAAGLAKLQAAAILLRRRFLF